ncbi:zinc finger CCCH domain-containing protein 13-like [Penaeus indicus]|uniref:zinc finger CCCH domain-containing protein 13-like n=1 Tax=Penaeus indicus TaxID=29960 RepID=UPI00300C3227
MRRNAPERSIAVLVVGDYLKVFEFKRSIVLVINIIKGMEIATNCKDSFPSLRLSFERPAEVPSADDSVETLPGDNSTWLYVAVALFVLLALVVLFGVAACCRLRRKVASQELEALGQPSAYTHPALSSSPSPSLAEAKSRHEKRYSTLLASDAVAVPNGHSNSGGGGHLSGLPDLAPPPLPSTSPPSLPHHPDGASPPVESGDVRRTLEWRDNSCHADAKGPQETPWSSADDGEDDYADPEELETPPWLRIQGADDDEEHDYADPRELEKPAWLLAQDADDYHDYDYIDRDALKVLLDRDREETQRKSAAADEARLSRHDSENSLYEEMKALEAARESRAREEQRQREQQREERELQKRQERQEVEEQQKKDEKEKQQERQEEEEQQQRDEKEKQQQMEEEEQDQNEQIQHNQANELKESEQELLESGKLEAK